MNISEIKASVGVKVLELRTATTEAGADTDWMRHWDNDNRVAVSIHKDLVKDLKGDPGIATLGLQKEIRTTSKGSYTAFRIVNFTNTAPVEEVL
jgi:hypothetical protein